MAVTRTVTVTLTKIGCASAVRVDVELARRCPRCLIYAAARVAVDIGGEIVEYEVLGLTDESVLSSIGRWLMTKLGADAAAFSRAGSIGTAADAVPFRVEEA